MLKQLKIAELKERMAEIQEELDELESYKTPNEQYYETIDQTIKKYKQDISDATRYYEKRKEAVEKPIRERYEAELTLAHEKLKEDHERRLDQLEEKFKRIIDNIRNKSYSSKGKALNPEDVEIEFNVIEEI